jgi:hypothetical protein
MALPTNNKLGLNSLPGTNSLTFYEDSQITDGKSFITLGPGANIIKRFSVASDGEAK